METELCRINGRLRLQRKLVLNKIKESYSKHKRSKIFFRGIDSCPASTKQQSNVSKFIPTQIHYFFYHKTLRFYFKIKCKQNNKNIPKTSLMATVKIDMGYQMFLLQILIESVSIQASIKISRTNFSCSRRLRTSARD